MGKGYILMQYAIDHPNSIVVLQLSPALVAQYMQMLKTYKITNVKLVS